MTFSWSLFQSLRRRRLRYAFPPFLFPLDQRLYEYASGLRWYEDEDGSGGDGDKRKSTIFLHFHKM